MPAWAPICAYLPHAGHCQGTCISYCGNGMVRSNTRVPQCCVSTGNSLTENGRSIFRCCAHCVMLLSCFGYSTRRNWTEGVQHGSILPRESGQQVARPHRIIVLSFLSLHLQSTATLPHHGPRVVKWHCVYATSLPIQPYYPRHPRVLSPWMYHKYTETSEYTLPR